MFFLRILEWPDSAICSVLSRDTFPESPKESARLTWVPLRLHVAMGCRSHLRAGGKLRGGLSAEKTRVLSITLWLARLPFTLGLFRCLIFMDFSFAWKQCCVVILRLRMPVPLPSRFPGISTHFWVLVDHCDDPSAIWVLLFCFGGRVSQSPGWPQTHQWWPWAPDPPASCTA